MPKARAYHHGDLRPALIKAALTLVERGGPDSVTLRAVARRARVSEAAPYHHFEDKSALLAHAAEAGFRSLGARFEAAARTRSPRLRLERMAEAYVRFAFEEPGMFRLIFGAHVQELARSPATYDAGRAAREHLQSAIAAFLGEVPLALPARRLFQLFWAQVHGTAWLCLEQELREVTSADGAVALARQGVRVLLEGLSR
jgi:AcrR family transcriptional regulator